MIPIFTGVPDGFELDPLVDEPPDDPADVDELLDVAELLLLLLPQAASAPQHSTTHIASSTCRDDGFLNISLPLCKVNVRFAIARLPHLTNRLVDDTRILTTKSSH
jgi:hypothetical protein